MPSFDTLAPGAEPVAAYQPIFELGRGGMGTVHLARAVGAGGFERLVVIKRLKQDLVDSREAVRRFLDEARHAALINHANVVGIHQIGRDAQGYFLVLDYVEGGSLYDLIDRATQRGRRLPPSIVLRIALDALAGLSAAHGATDAAGRSLNLLHRDVSPQNVLVGRDGVSRLADFGVAKSVLASVQTDQRYVVGKLLYLPPEYLAHRPVGPTLDIYSLGVTLWMAFAGAEPWPEATEAELVARICQDAIPTLSSTGVRIAPQVEDMVMRACDPDPKLRPQSARDMADEIDAMARETGWVASHAEVADLLEDLIGADLSARKERVASILATLPRPDAPSESTHRSVAPPTVTTKARTASAAERSLSGRTPIVVAAGIVLLVLAALYEFGGRPSDGSAKTSPSAENAAEVERAAHGSPAAEEPAAPSLVSARTIAPSPTPALNPTDLPLDDATRNGRTKGQPRPVTTKSATRNAESKARGAPPVTAAPAAPEPSPPVVTPVPVAPRAPDDISKANPYR